MSNQSTLSTLLNIFAAPGEAFTAIKQRPTFLVPLLLLCAATSAASWLYTAEVDIGWLTEQQLRTQTLLDLTDAQIEQMANQAADRGRGLTLASGVIGTFIFIIALVLLQALYLKIVSAFRKDGIRYKQWLSLVCWTSLPAVLGSIATIVFVLTNDVTFMAQTDINPLSFANLLQFDLSDASVALRLVSNLSPVNIWPIVLVVLGYRSISTSSPGTAIAVVLAPVAIIAAFVIALI